MKQDVFGSKGHFTTSPEISQIFGELIGAWLLNEWNRFGEPKPLNFVEIGPGRGKEMQTFLTHPSHHLICSSFTFIPLIHLPYPSLLSVSHPLSRRSTGTLTDDITRVFSQFPKARSCLSISLVEISPFLRQVQEQNLCGTTSVLEQVDANKLSVHSSLTKLGFPITWYPDLDSIPETSGFTLYVCHEFLGKHFELFGSSLEAPETI